MFEQMTDDDDDDRRTINPTALRPGTLIFLWPPGERPWRDGVRPTIARVEKATAYMVMAVDVRDGARGGYQVDVNPGEPTGQLWTWEVVEAPCRPAVRDGVEHVDGGSMSLEQRVRMICGEIGATVRFGMRDGSTVSGRLTSLIQDDPEAREADWFELTGPADQRGQIVHWGRVPDIITITRVDG